jgi:hypothetical protein
MARKPNTVLLPIMATAIFALLLSAYIGGYLCLGTCIDHRGSSVPGATGIERNYLQTWQPHLFRPAATVESLVRGCDVVLSYSHVPPK